MLRGYFSLAIPVGLTAAAALTWMHFRDALPALADQGEVQLAQAQPGVDPFAPPPDAVQPAPAPGVIPPAPPAVRPKRPGKQEVEVPKSKDEVKTPILRSLLDSLDSMQEGTDEEKDGLRQMLYEADVELRDALGTNLRDSIRAANNNRSKAILVKPPVRRLPLKKRPEVKPAPSTTPSTTPPATPTPGPAPTPPPAESVEPMPTPTPTPPPPTKPMPDAFDDLFKDPAPGAANK